MKWTNGEDSIPDIWVGLWGFKEWVNDLIWGELIYLFILNIGVSFLLKKKVGLGYNPI